MHVAKAESDGRITYHSFPRLIIYQETDTLKNISLKVFKGMRGTIAQSFEGLDQNFVSLNENEAYN